MPTRAAAGHRRSRRLVPILALLLGGALASHAEPPARARTPALELYWHDPSNALRFPHRFVGDKVVEALGHLEVPATWRGADPDVVTHGRELRIVLLAEDRSPATRARGVIGAVHRDPTARTIWILLPNLQRALGLRGPLSPELRDMVLLSHAVARVVVHEIFHLVAPDQPHAPGSLMQAHFARQDLLAPIRLEPGLGVAFLAALRAPEPPSDSLLAAGRDPAPAATPIAALP